MRTKGGDSRGSDKDLAKTPSLYIFSVLVGGPKTTPPPVLTLCALSGPPHHLGFLYYCVGWLCKSQWGSWTTGAGAFSTKRSVMSPKGFLSIRSPILWKRWKNCAAVNFCTSKKEGLRLGQKAIIEAPKPICWIKTTVSGSLLASNS